MAGLRRTPLGKSTQGAGCQHKEVGWTPPGSRLQSGSREALSIQSQREVLPPGKPLCLAILQVVGQKQDEVSPVIHVRLREQEPDAATSMALLQQVGLEITPLWCSCGGFCPAAGMCSSAGVMDPQCNVQKPAVDAGHGSASLC